MGNVETYSVYLLVALVLNPIPSSSFLFSHGSGVFRPVTIKGYPGLVLLGVFVGLRTSGWAKGSFFLLGGRAREYTLPQLFGCCSRARALLCYSTYSVLWSYT